MNNPRLIPNAGTVLLKASSLWAAYGAIVIDVGIKVLEYVRDNRAVRWQDMVVPVLLLLVPAFRVIQQRSITLAERPGIAQKELPND